MRRAYILLKTPYYKSDFPSRVTELSRGKEIAYALILRNRLKREKIPEEWFRTCPDLKEPFLEDFLVTKARLKKRKVYKEKYEAQFRDAIRNVFALIRGKIQPSECRGFMGEVVDALKEHAFGRLDLNLTMKNFGYYFSIFAARLLYKGMQHLEDELKAKEDNKEELVAEALERLAKPLADLVVKKKFEKGWLRQIAPKARRWFKREYRGLQKDLAKDQLYRWSLLEYLKDLARAVFKLTRCEFELEKLRPFPQKIAGDLIVADQFANDKRFPRTFKDGLSIAIARYACYSMTDAFAAAGIENLYGAVLTKNYEGFLVCSVVDAFVSQSPVLTGFRSNLRGISRQQFDEHFKKLCEKLKRDKLYVLSFHYVLQGLVETVFAIMSGQLADDELTLEQHTIANDLTHYSIDPDDVDNSEQENNETTVEESPVEIKKEKGEEELDDEDLFDDNPTNERQENQFKIASSAPDIDYEVKTDELKQNSFVKSYIIPQEDELREKIQAFRKEYLEKTSKQHAPPQWITTELGEKLIASVLVFIDYCDEYNFEFSKSPSEFSAELIDYLVTFRSSLWDEFSEISGNKKGGGSGTIGDSFDLVLQYILYFYYDQSLITNRKTFSSSSLARYLSALLNVIRGTEPVDWSDVNMVNSLLKLCGVKAIINGNLSDSLTQVEWNTLINSQACKSVNVDIFVRCASNIHDFHTNCFKLAQNVKNYIKNHELKSNLKAVLDERVLVLNIGCDLCNKNRAIVRVLSNQFKKTRSSKAFKDALGKIVSKRINLYIKEIISFILKEYESEEWDFANFKKLNSNEIKLIDDKKQKILIYLGNIDSSFTRFHKMDEHLIEKILLATPLILNSKYIKINSINQINKIIDYRTDTIINALKLFKSSKFSQVGSQGYDFLPEEIVFLNKYNIDTNNLKKKWQWIDFSPDLISRYGRYVLLPLFLENVKSQQEIAKIIKGLRFVLQKKLKLTLKQLCYSSGFSPEYYRKKGDINKYFLDKSTPEAILVKELCNILEFSPGDIGSYIYSRGKGIKERLTSMELSKYKATYRGWSEDSINLLENFLDNLPTADEIDDDFQTIMVKRKESALSVFHKYIEIKRSTPAARSLSPTSPDFDWSEEKFSSIAPNLQTILKPLISHNLNFKFPSGVFIPTNPRCSEFKIEGNKFDSIRNWDDYIPTIEAFIKQKKLVLNSQIGISLTKLAQSDHTLNHIELLPSILKNHPNSILMEIFVWMPIESKDTSLSAFVTGIIDLILISNDIVYIVDYKPDKNIYRSLPQVASYGLIIKSLINYKNIVCISFNDETSIQFRPEILYELSPLIKMIQRDHPTFRPQWKEVFN